jgi:hypothetical protein
VAHELTHTLQQGFRKARPIASSALTSPTTATRPGLPSHALAKQIQRWEDVQTGRRLESYDTRAGAISARRRLQRQHPRLEYRIVQRGRNFIIQSRTASAGSRSSSTTSPRPAFNPPQGRWVLVYLQRRGSGAGGTGLVRVYDGTRLTHIQRIGWPNRPRNPHRQIYSRRG